MAHYKKNKFAKKLLLSGNLLLLIVFLFMIIFFTNSVRVEAAPILDNISVAPIASPITIINSISSPVQIYMSDSYYRVGELINITLSYPETLSGKIYVEIYNLDSPEYFYRYIDMISTNIVFMAIEPGRYAVRVYEQPSNLLLEKNFIVYSLHTDCESYSAGETISIDIGKYIRDINPQTSKQVYLLHYDTDGVLDTKLKYDDVLNDLILFSKPKIGRYDLLINDVYAECYNIADSISGLNPDYLSSEYPLNSEFNQDGLNQKTFNTFLNQDFISYSSYVSDAETAKIQEYLRIKHYYEDKNVSNIQSIIGLDSYLSNADSESLSQILLQKDIDGKAYTKVSDSHGKFKNIFLVLRDNNNDSYTEGNVLDINSMNISGDTYQLDMYFADSTVKKIRFNKLNYSRGVDLGLEDLPISDLIMTNTSRGDFINAFAIDPERVQFTDATVTFTAVGNALWKCKDYDFNSRTCTGEFVKILDIVPGKEYSFILTPEDPVFAQSNYLTNPSFDTNITTGWTTVLESGTPVFSWIASDSGRSGLAQISASGNNRVWYGSYYQTFNLSIPQGTQLVNATFSVFWRISTYTLADPGSIYFWIQNASNNITSCNFTQAFSSTTTWANITLKTNGSNGCFLSNFTANQNYNIRLRCYLDTRGGGGTKDVRCLWDDASVIAYYIDIQSPNITYINQTPNPVNYGNIINFTANITDNIQIDKVWVLINGSNYTMNYSGTGDIYYFDRFNTSIYPMNYTYIVYSNDTSSNIANRTGNFTINDNITPRLNIINPGTGIYSNVTNNYFYYNVSDESTIANCSLRVDDVIVATNYSVQSDIQQSLNATVSQGIHYWNITCYDNSTNRNSNTSYVRNITIDSILPSVALNTPGNNAWASGYETKAIYFNYTPIDQNFDNCSLYGNFSGVYSWNQTNTTITNASINSFKLYLNDNSYLWNIQCCDKANNCAFNNTNFTARIDSTPPYWSNTLTNYPSESIWITPRMYQFNITWSEALTNISRVWIEHNFSGPLQNYSVSNISNVYIYNISNLSAGYYVYKWYANDSLNNINSTGMYVYIVNKTPSTIQLLLNGTDGDMDIGQDDTVNITALLQIPTTGYIELYQDGVLINSGNTILNNITQYFAQQQYNITARYLSTQNYSESTSTHFVTVKDTIPPIVSLGNPENYSWNPKTVVLYYTPNDNIDITNCTLILDGVVNITQNSTIFIENNFTINVSDGTHNWTVGCRDSKNNYGQNNTVKYIRVDTQSPTPFALVRPLDNTISNNNTPLLNWSQTIETNFANYTILVDNNPNFLFPDYTYYTLSVSDSTYQVSSASPWDNNILYWFVTAYDVVGNTYATGYYMYTVDTQPPTINILNPENNYYSTNLTQNFTFTLTDFTEIINCSLYINNNVDQTNYTINKSVTQMFRKTFASQGDYNWSIECYDQASNRQITTYRRLYIDQTPPATFNLLNPQNQTLSKNNTPVLNWSQTIETNFANYTIQISDTNIFTNINYTYSTFVITNTTYIVSLPDTTWYWRVTAYDNANNNYTTGYYSYEPDTTPPTAFNLLTPENMTSSNNTSPVLNWSQTSEKNFKNYTIYVSDNIDYSHINFTYTTFNISNTTYQATNWPMNVEWYWRVIAFDNASNNYTTGTYKYTTDNETPIVKLVTPQNNSIWNTSSLVSFIFNVSDVSEIRNCTLIINGADSRVLTTVSRDINQEITESLINGIYNWSINCTDASGLIGMSSTQRVTVNITLPSNRFWETNPSGTPAIPPPANNNLSYTYDGTENTITQAVGSGVDYNIANATIIFNGAGFLLYSGTQINFSGVFQASSTNRGYVNWGLYKKNTSGTYLICETPNNTNGQLITTRNVKETETSSCVSPSSTIKFDYNDSMILRVNIYNSGPSTTYIHYIDNANPSYIQLDGYKLGTLNVTLINITDQQPGEDYAFIERCNITCTNGYCLDTDVHYELNNSETQNYILIGSTGNIILNGSQNNPTMFATINSTIIANASLFANIYSANNSFRCYAESAHSNATSNTKNITVRDITLPTVSLLSPGIIYSTDPGIIEFSYIPYDKRLKNCTLYNNASGSWAPNQINTTPTNNSINYFYANFSQYGTYVWNIQCCDIVGNCAFNDTNRTINIAGDLGILNEDVYFSDSTPSEFENITIFARIYNLANRTEQNVLITFYENDPDISGTPIGDVYANISGLSNVTVNTTWIASKGIHYFYVKIDPADNIIESDETNNKAHNQTFTAVWQTYYGNITVALKSLGVDTNTIINWTLDAGVQGNIFITDSDSTPSWTTLRALTRDIYNNLTSNTTDDFEELDTCLNTTQYGDNINSTYSMNGLPAITSTYNIYNVLVENVPESQSTNNTNFYSGILWDVSDSVNDYYSCNPVPALREDIVFVTKINEANDGKFGTYDYEMKVSGELGDYKGTNPSVSFYYELK